VAILPVLLLAGSAAVAQKKEIRKELSLHVGCGLALSAIKQFFKPNQLFLCRREFICLRG
jgi:hypothetical protein